MWKYVTCLCVCALLQQQRLDAQTPTFMDNFNRPDLATGAPTSYTTTVTTTGPLGAPDGGAQIVSGSYLQLTNDATGATNRSGYVSVAGTTSSYGSDYSPTLSANAMVEWSVNFKYDATAKAPDGFGLGRYGVAVVLAANEPDFTSSTASGYAIAYGDGGSADPIRLVRFQGGFRSSNEPNAVEIISSGATPNLAIPQNYASARVLLNGATGEWSLFVRDDGATAWDDPHTVTTQVGTSVTDTTYTSQKLDYFGYYWSYGSGANQTASFDNYAVAVSPVAEPAMIISACLVALVATVSARSAAQWRVRRVRSPTPSLA